MAAVAAATAAADDDEEVLIVSAMGEYCDVFIMIDLHASREERAKECT